MKKLLLLFMGQLFLMSCVNFKQPAFENKYRADYFNIDDITNFNRSYKLKATDDSSIRLDQIFGLNDTGIYRQIEAYKINLSFESEEMLVVKLIRNNELISKEVVKGSFDSGHFVSESKLSIPLFTLLFNVITVDKVRIGLLANQNLAIDFVENGLLMITILPFRGAGDDSYGLIFEPLRSS